MRKRLLNLLAGLFSVAALPLVPVVWIALTLCLVVAGLSALFMKALEMTQKPPPDAPVPPMEDNPVPPVGDDGELRARHELEFGLALATFFGTLWYLGFGRIISITHDVGYEFQDSMLLASTIGHALLFIGFVFSLLLLADMGLAATVGRSRLPREAYGIFMYAWPFVLIAYALLCLLASLGLLPYYFLYTACLIVVVAVLVSVLLLWLINRESTLIAPLRRIALGGVLVSSLVPVHIVCMTAAFADIRIQTDRDFYHADERAVIKVTPVGYMKLPFVNGIRLGDGALLTRSDASTFEIKLKGGSPLVWVQYSGWRPWRFRRERLHVLRVLEYRPPLIEESSTQHREDLVPRLNEWLEWKEVSDDKIAWSITRGTAGETGEVTIYVTFEDRNGNRVADDEMKWPIRKEIDLKIGGFADVEVEGLRATKAEVAWIKFVPAENPPWDEELMERRRERFRTWQNNDAKRLDGDQSD